MISENSRKVLEKRYLKRDESGKLLETPTEMFKRVAVNVASAEARYSANADLDVLAAEYYEMMASMEFLPNSPTLMNAGRDLQQLSACFVLPIEDSMDSIFNTLKYTALIHKSGGGTGFSFSKLRPKGDIVRSTRGVSSGPVSFMKVFNSATEAVKQGGTRRGANMGVLRVDHPDILEFIKSKETNKDLENFNISVALTEDFMRSVESNTTYSLRNPRGGEPIGELNAREVFELIVEMAWKSGDPGIIFIDRVNRDNVTPELGEIESTNPCGEQPLLPYEACNLGSINLAKMVKETGSGFEVDLERMKKTIRTAVHFLDNVIDVSEFPLEKIDQLVKGNRKIGLGVMGWSDMLAMLEIPYDSQEAVELGEKIMKFIADESHQRSMEIAELKGSFPNFAKSVYPKQGVAKIRNATTTTIAPTGTLSIIANCSSGIEPLFAICFTRHVMDNDKLVEVNPVFEALAKREGFFSEEVMEKIAITGSAHGVKEVPEKYQRVFVTAHEVAPEWHIKMQAAYQRHTDNAVSKTVNFHSDATVGDVEEVYRLAYKLGCKGVTIFRDGCKGEQVLNIKGEDKAALDSIPVAPHELEPRKRPNITFGRTERIDTGCGNLYVTINEDDNGMCEVFATMGKAGGCAAAQAEAVSRMVSLSLRAGIKPQAIVKHLRGIRCNAPAWAEGGQILSCPDAVAIVMEHYLKWKSTGAFETRVGKATDELAVLAGACPDCGSAVEHEGGCLVCRVCGFSKCY